MTDIGPAHQERAVQHSGYSHNSGLAHPRSSMAHSNPSDVQGRERASVSVIVPWRPGDPQRGRVWTWIREYWQSRFPEYELITCDDGTEPFTRGRSINRGVESSSGDILVFADADTIVGHIEEAVRLAQLGYWVIAYPQGRYCALTEEATETLLARDPREPLTEPKPDDCRDQITSYSGVVVMPRAAYDKIDGMDPRFVAWGSEDFALMWALDTLWRGHERASGYAVHLYHEHREEERFDNPHFAANKALADEYQNCFGNPSAMAALIRER